MTTTSGPSTPDPVQAVNEAASVDKLAPPSHSGWIARLAGRRGKIIGSQELYQDWPDLSTHAIKKILKALVSCGDTGCSKQDLPSLSDMPRSVLEPALGQLGQDHLVSHRIIEYRGLFGLCSRTRIHYTITDRGRDYLGSDGWGGTAS